MMQQWRKTAAAPRRAPPRRSGRRNPGTARRDQVAGTWSCISLERRPVRFRSRSTPRSALSGPHSGRRAEIVQNAVLTTGSAGDADPPTVQDQPQAELAPLLGRHELVELQL